ncbi:MAG: transcriptional regulator [Flavobacteriales bacterium]|nr:MAG: transcriptional regulator [Flavobacteriales bacterium]
MFLKIVKIYLVLSFLGCFLAANAQYVPYIENYQISDYNAGNQNWDVATAENGMVYVANSKGLLAYDGLVWKLHEMPNKTIVRSVMATDDKIYVGSYEEFGYWQKNEKGILTYFSLSKSFTSNTFTDEDFWQILKIDNSILFRSFSALYLAFENTIKKIKAPSTIISCSKVHGKILVATLKHGIFQFDNNRLIPYFNDPFLTHKKINTINGISKDTLFITTALHGCFLFYNNKLSPWKTAINEVFKTHQLNTFSIYDNGKMAFGTIKNGMYLTDKSGNIIHHLNRQNGLYNNTILGHVTYKNTLWLGMDNGIAQVDLNDNFLYYHDRSGNLGAVYDVAKYKNNIYLAANTGIYYLDKQNNLRFINGSQGQAWSLNIIENQLFCGHNNGTYRIDNKKIRLISEFTGGFDLKKVPENSNTYIQGTYVGLVTFINKGNGNWTVSHLGKQTNPLKYLAFENSNQLWVADAYKGIYKISTDNEYNKLLSVKDYKDKGLSSDFNVRVYNIKNNIIFKTNSQWEYYDPILDSILPLERFNNKYGKEAVIISDSNMNQLAVKYPNYIGIGEITNDEEEIVIDKKYYEGSINIGNEKLISFDNNTYLLCLNEGFLLIKNNVKNSRPPLQAPKIEQLIIKNDTLALSDYTNTPIPHNTTVKILLSAPKNREHHFEYSFTQNGSNWLIANKDKVVYTNLSGRNRDIYLRAVNKFGSASPITALTLNMEPPWYLDTSGILLYFFIAAAFIFTIVKWNRNKLKREQRLMTLKHKREQRQMLREKAIENEKQLIQLKNKSLKNEVTIKSKQLANTAMSLVKKNETLQQLKREFALNKANFNGNIAYNRIIRQIDASIGDQDEWQLFEYNFNQVHEDFFNTLQNEYPQLTRKDLKLSAYIKMDLPSKEIAPLMNISVRGVETHRYRLKKKLQLGRDEDLNNFLRNINK